MTGFGVGSLVAARGREWVVLPESGAGVLVVRPLGGTDDDVAAILPELEPVEPATFPPPDPADLGDFGRAGLLRSALRIGFRAGAGPFRSLAGLSVEPRPYQFVPLLMGLRQDTVRLLIADDVGIGKTVEAGLVAAELLAGGEARGLTVLCGPALAEQWRDELAGKFGIDAELVLPSTVTRLERSLLGSESLFGRYRHTIVSTDFIKSDRRRHEFVRACPDLVIVDEAHTCVADDTRAGAAGAGRMLRYQLLTELAAEATRHLLLVTATPHSGKEASFRNLLGLLDPELSTLDLELPRNRERLARHFVQRRRADIRRYLDETTPFPRDRQCREIGYHLTADYQKLFGRVLDFAREQVRDDTGGPVRQRVRWWSALALLRALASSPRAAAATLATRAAGAAVLTVAEADALGRSTVLDQVVDEAVESADVTPGADTGADTDPEPGAEPALPDAGPHATTRQRLRELARQARALEGAADAKLAVLVGQVEQLLAEGYPPIVFCRFIDTAEYVAEHLTAALGPTVAVAAVTGTLPPAERLARIAELTAAPESPGTSGTPGTAPGRHVLVATDCLSEGVNLQEHFRAVVHYDLAWNPTRHEQREGRVDRFGQRADVVRALTLYGEDNGIDGIVLNVLLRKHEAIRRATGVSVPVPAESNSLVEALMEGVLLRGHDTDEQLELDLLVTPRRDALHERWQSAAQAERESRTKYAQAGIRPEQVAAQVAAVREALGEPAEIAGFTREALRALGATITTARVGPAEFTASTGALPPALREALPERHAEPLPFGRDWPVPPGSAVLARTDSSVEATARYVLDAALDARGDPAWRPARRCGVSRTRAVAARTTLLLVRYRFHLVLPARSGDRPMVAEDAEFLAYRGRPAAPEWLPADQVRALLGAAPDANVPPDQAAAFAERAVAALPELAGALDARGEELAGELRAAHRAVREAAGALKRNLRVTAQRPADVLGVYVYLPVHDTGVHDTGVQDTARTRAVEGAGDGR